ncbi:MAG: hypothetical protein C5B59_06195 [Bacteroidetes bacterium]|nr:MAG: hypothetical protein C5B59_06195 [Bacteroidota bacterium]
MVYFIVSNIVPIIIIVSLLQLFVIILHELGHAIPILFMTEGKVEIYLGSFGDSRKCIKLSVKRLDVFLKYNPLEWTKGVCQPPNEKVSTNKKILYMASGPIVSLLLTVISFYILFSFEFSGFSRFVLVLLFCFGLTTLFSSIIPTKISKFASNGQPLNNDAMQIVQLFKHKRLPENYKNAIECYTNKQFTQAADLFDKIPESGNIDLITLRKAISSNLLANRFNKAEQLLGIISIKYALNADDYANLGYLKYHSEKYDEALECYYKSLQLNPDHVCALNNIGYTLAFKKNLHAEAIVFLDKVIDTAPDFANAYSSRGYAKVRLGEREEGLLDIKHCLQLDEKNSFGYLVLGIYYLEKNEFKEALSNFEIVKKLDGETISVSEFMELTNQRMKTSNS